MADEKKTLVNTDSLNKKSNIASKNLIKFMLIFIALIVIAVIIIVTINAIRGKNLSYEQIEGKMISATKEYIITNKEVLPTNNTTEVYVSVDTLVAAELIKPLSELKHDIVCTGKVKIRYVSSDNYNYVPYLDCGNEYTAIEMYNEIIKSSNIVTSGTGLYYMNNEYVYRGENPNNYLRLGNEVYRIVKVDNNNNIMLIYNTLTNVRTHWDDRYNIEEDDNSGVNTYFNNNIDSRIKEHLTKLYSDDDETFTDAVKSKLVGADICIGKRTRDDTSKNGDTECKTTISNQYLSLLPLYDYMNAGLDDDCINANSVSCGNYNYLSTYKRTWWTITGSADDTNKVYIIYPSGKIGVSKAEAENNVRYVMFIDSDIMYKGGTGTEENPYIVR